MRQPLQIRFHHMQPSEALEARIRRRVHALERLQADIISCQVAVAQEHRHQQQGNLFSVRVNLTVPGREIVVNHVPADDRACEDAYVAIRNAFDAARRLLEEYLRVRRGDVKRREPDPV